jgi:beta-barrel assembly-enhancing protease
MALPFSRPDQNLPPKVDAYYCDGLTPIKHPAVIQVLAGELHFQTPGNRNIAWSFAAINWDLSILRADYIQLVPTESEDVRLVVLTPVIRGPLEAAIRDWRRQHFWKARPATRDILKAIVQTLALLFFLWFAWPFIADRIAPYAPHSLRNVLAQREYALFTTNFKVCETPEGRQAIDTLQARLQSAMHTSHIIVPPITVVDLPIPNAWTLPNHQIIITRPLLDDIKNGDEVAGVLAHELGHVLHDHVVRHYIRRALPNVIFESMGSGLTNESSILNRLAANAYSRDVEREADRTAVDILKNAHISPQGLTDLFAHDAQTEKHGRKILDYFLTHPQPTDRATQITAAVGKGNAGDTTPALSDVEWQALHDICGKRPLKSPPQ